MYQSATTTDHRINIFTIFSFPVPMVVFEHLISRSFVGCCIQPLCYQGTNTIIKHSGIIYLLMLVVVLEPALLGIGVECSTTVLRRHKYNYWEFWHFIPPGASGGFLTCNLRNKSQVFCHCALKTQMSWLSILACSISWCQWLFLNPRS
jgi:hypothetical protein